MPNYVTQPCSRAWKKQGGKCHYCSLRMVPPQANHPNDHPHLATVDHKKPASQGGTRDRQNVVLACARCNMLRGTWDYLDFVRICFSLKQQGLLGKVTTLKGLKQLEHV